MNLSLPRMKTIKVETKKEVLTIQLHRPNANNSLNSEMLDELMSVLVFYEDKQDIKIVILEGLPLYFCNGIDFKAISDGTPAELLTESPKKFYGLLKHLAFCSKVIISKVEGRVNAGGIGLIAVSDIVVANEKASFSLSEALFGLLPSCVLPFLIRRIGYQKALWMSLTTQQISAERAYEISLVDELTQNTDISLGKYLARLTKLNVSTIHELKNYMSKLWILNDETEQLAVNHASSLIMKEEIQANIKKFVLDGVFPWEGNNDN